MTWLKIKIVADLISVSERAVQQSIKQGKYQYRCVNGIGRGGIQYEIALESLPQFAQDQYNNVEAVPQYKDIMQFTGKQRQDADFKALVVVEYRRSGLSPDEFVSTFNTRNPEDMISKHQLFRWQQKYKQNGDVADLIDKRGGHNRGKSSISDEAWEHFCNWYMTQQERSIKRCWELTKNEFPDIPSVSAFEYKVKTTIPKIALIRYRKGEKAFNDSLPSMRRSRADINSNDIWFSDHHLSDVFVINKAGKLVRLWITVFFDARSNKVMGVLVRDAKPNATAIKQCFRKAVEKHRVISKNFYFDNGTDYKSKAFSQDFPMSIVRQLGINSIYATPYHGQAKTVERFFGTLEDRFGRLFSTYAGRDAKNRPEIMRQKEEEILKFAPTMDEFTTALDDYIAEYNQTPSRGIDMDGKSPNQVYDENLKEKVTCDLDMLRTLCGTFEERTVNENGVQILNNFYKHDLLISRLGEKVIVSYYPENIDEINVFDMNYRAICIAYAQIKTPFRNTTEEDYKRAGKEKKAVRDFTKKYKPSRPMDIHNIISRNQLEEKVYSETASPTQVTQVTQITKINPQIIKNQEIFKSTEKTPFRRSGKEENLAGEMLSYYENKKGG